GASLSAAALGTASRALDTDVTTLEATASSGGIFVRERNALNLTAQASGGAVDVRTRNGSLVVANARGDGVTLVAGGAGSTLTLDGVVDAGSGNVALTAGTASARGAIVGRANHHITGNALTATGSS